MRRELLGLVTTLMLNRLSERDGVGLVQQLAGTASLSGDIVDEIVDRADGVPLFVEELTKAVLESGDRGGGRNHTRGQANPLEVAPREGFPPCRNRDLGAAQFPPAPLSVTACTASLGSATPAKARARKILNAPPEDTIAGLRGSRDPFCGPTSRIAARRDRGADCR